MRLLTYLKNILIFLFALSSRNMTIWKDSSCHEAMGFVCEIQNNIRLQLLGLCTDSAIDKEYIGIGIKNERRTFRGKFASTLEWSEEASVWMLKSSSSKGTYAFHNKSSEYPLGSVR